MRNFRLTFCEQRKHDRLEIRMYDGMQDDMMEFHINKYNLYAEFY